MLTTQAEYLIVPARDNGMYAYVSPSFLSTLLPGNPHTDIIQVVAAAVGKGVFQSIS
jgi:hypothetical protein